LSVTEIPNNRLAIADIPVSNSEWDVIQRFALTFNGYSSHGSFEACGKIANERRGATLTDLRTCLFFEQRRWRHFGYAPKSDDLAYIRGIVDRIREKVQTGLVD
jgi:hypothetical protein